MTSDNRCITETLGNRYTKIQNKKKRWINFKEKVFYTFLLAHRRVFSSLLGRIQVCALKCMSMPQALSHVLVSRWGTKLQPGPSSCDKRHSYALRCNRRFPRTRAPSTCSRLRSLANESTSRAVSCGHIRWWAQRKLQASTRILNKLARGNSRVRVGTIILELHSRSNANKPGLIWKLTS